MPRPAAAVYTRRLSAHPRRHALGLFALLAASAPGAPRAEGRAPDVAPFVSVGVPLFALTHVRVIDGTGAPAREDQTVLIEGEKIRAVGPFATVEVPAAAQSFDRTGYSVIPGLVGMHDHLYYTASVATQRGADGRIGEPGLFVNQVAYTAPRLYLAAGVTTIRTTGSNEPYADLKVKRRIDDGLMPGPHVDVTAPYLEGKPTLFAQMHELKDADDARRLVDYWATEGATSFKGYMNLTRDELRAAIDEAHRHKLKLTAHLCSITWKEAIALGIDDLEHGPVYTDSDFVEGKKPDLCTPPRAIQNSWAALDIAGPQATELIKLLVAHHVAVTSTLPVFEAFSPGRPKLDPRVLDALSANARESYLTARAGIPLDSPAPGWFKKELQFELAFARAGGLLLAGLDPTGNGGVVAGFGDQREVELLVEAGFTPVEAIQIATENGARYLGQLDRIGTIAAGKHADLVLIKGDPSKLITEIENVETVFKDGVGYDSKRLIESVRGQVGIR
jgi:imidazolonepropionase-like amidohydrolase